MRTHLKTHFWRKVKIANMAKIMVNVQKRLNGASAEAGFWYGDNLDHVKEKSSK